MAFQKSGCRLVLKAGRCVPAVLVSEDGHTPFYSPAQMHGLVVPHSRAAFSPKKECPLSYLRGHLLNKQTLTQFFLYRVLIYKSHLACAAVLTTAKLTRFAIIWDAKYAL